MSKDPILSQILRGLLGQRLYRLLKVLVFGKPNEALDNATPMGRAEAEEALQENAENIGKIQQAIGSGKARIEEFNRILEAYQPKLEAAQRLLERAIQDRKPEEELEDLAAQVVELENFTAQTQGSIQGAEGILNQAKRALAEAQREQDRLMRQKQLADLRGQLANALEDVRGQQDSGQLDVVRRYTSGAERRLDTAVAVDELANGAPGRSLERAERSLSTQDAIARAKQKLGLPASDAQPLRLEPSAERVIDER